MAVAGVGVDLVEVARFTAMLARTPGVADRLFTEPSGRPTLRVSGTVAAVAAALGVRRWHVSLSHDGGLATAVVVAET